MLDELSYKTNAPELHIVIPRPFKRSKKYNNYYTSLFGLLEYNTNRLVIGNRYGNGIPVNKQMLMTLWGVTRQTCENIISAFIVNKIIAQIKLGKQVSYLVNPNYVICGDKINSFVYKIFENGMYKTIFSDLDKIVEIGYSNSELEVVGVNNE